MKRSGIREDDPKVWRLREIEGVPLKCGGRGTRSRKGIVYRCSHQHVRKHVYPSIEVDVTDEHGAQRRQLVFFCPACVKKPHESLSGNIDLHNPPRLWDSPVTLSPTEERYFDALGSQLLLS
eukprot:jgi/Mesvir1/7535/Mv19282-RA.1